MSGDSENELLKQLQRILENPAETTMPPEIVRQLMLATLLNLDRRMRNVESLAPIVKVLMFIFSAIGASIIALIWSLITGQATIMFS